MRQDQPIQTRIHHSSFTKPGIEYAGVHIWPKDFIDSKNGMQKDMARESVLKQ